MALESPAPLADDAEVADVAREATGDPGAELLDWSAAPLGGVTIISTTGGLHRIVGRARSKGAEVEWSCVLKVLERPRDDECLDPASWCYWRREAAFYGSELPAVLPGRVRAPRAYGVVDADGEARVWMEYVAGMSGGWTPEDYGRAARAAGLTAGGYLGGTPLPDEPWLVRGFLRSLLGDGGFWATTMHRESGDTWRSPLAARFGPRTRERVLGVWADRDLLLASLDALPHVFGHGDLHSRNILLPSGGDDIVALDWGFCGRAAVGTELGDLIGLAAWFCDVDIGDLPGIERAAFGAYDDGLRAAGWDGDPRLVRLGYTTAVALRLGACMPGWAVLMLGPERAETSEVLFGRPAEAILAAWIELEEVFLDLADEARSLARQLGLAPP